MNDKTGSANQCSVVVVSYQTGPALWGCLYRLFQLPGVGQIVVINNGNESEVERHLLLLEKKHARLVVLTGHGNIGFAAGCNLGAKKATERFLLFLNPDAILVEQDAILKLTALFDEASIQPPVGLAGGILRDEDGSEQRGSRRNFLTPKNALVEGLGLQVFEGVNLPLLNMRTPPPTKPEPIPAISGACMMIERDRFEMLLGMDDAYFLHVEDMDLCKRVYIAGGSVWVHPGVNILHYRSTSDVKTLFIERMKAKGFHHYFSVHFAQDYFWRYLAHAAVVMNFVGQIFKSFEVEQRPIRQLTDPLGLRRMQAIVRGVEAVLQQSEEEEKPLPPGSKVLITGASSAIGLFAIGRLLAMGCKVQVIKHRTETAFFHPNLTWIEGDLSRPESLEPKLSPQSCDYVIHCAPIWMSKGFIPIVQKAGAKKIVAISSTSILYKAKSSNPEERETVHRLQDGENTLKRDADAANIKWTIMRPTMIYGAGLDQNVTRVAEEIDTTRKFMVNKPANGKRAPIHADDLAKAALNSFSSSASDQQVYNVSGNTVIEYQEMVEQIADVLGENVKIRAIKGLESICAFLHPLMPNVVPHQSVAMRMQQDLYYPDERVATDLKLNPRPFLEGGKADLGLCEDTICKELLPA